MCNCPDPALCVKLKKHICGRLWQIWHGFGMDREKANAYRHAWERAAGVELTDLPKTIVPLPPIHVKIHRRPDCIHLGKAVDNNNNKGNHSGCRGCWRHFCSIFGECTIRERRGGVKCCQDCPEYEADA